MPSSYTAAAALWRLVSNYAQQTPDWADPVIYETKPDEVNDITLVSLRVYGTRDEVLTIAAAAGLDSIVEPMPQRRLVLPPAAVLAQFKAQCGFSSSDDDRTAELAADPIGAR